MNAIIRKVTYGLHPHVWLHDLHIMLCLYKRAISAKLT